MQLHKLITIWLNLIFTIGSLIGIILITVSSYDVSVNIYRFFWFVTILSLIIAIYGIIYHQTNLCKKGKYYTMGILSIIMMLLWLATTLTMVKYIYYNTTGIIVSLVFGFLEVILWLIVLCYCIVNFKMPMRFPSVHTQAQAEIINMTNV